jgi:phosphoribosylformylglycinamidine (FGAM) synthase-like amidotransferase family enzyme
MKVLIINGNEQYYDMFKALGFTLTATLLDANLVCFTGGSDVSPILYGARSHAFTGNDMYRDEKEMDDFRRAEMMGVPMVGICRGGQFLNVMCGGSMYQHVSTHTNYHNITDAETGEVVYASSTHHQMMKPTSEAVLVAYSTNGGSREWYEGEVFHQDVSTKDIEVVYYKAHNCLCFQPHPEFGSVELDGLKGYFSSLLSRFLGLH